MTQIKRRTPYPEWVLMYRRGISASKIAAVTRVDESVIRYHLAVAAELYSGLWAKHQAALPRVPSRVTVASQRNLADILAFYKVEGRLPVNGRTPRE